MTAPEKILVIVAGMHRSGTSAVTGAIEGLGVRLPGTLAGPQKGINDRGYKEDLAVIDLHEALFWSLGSAWDDIFPTEIDRLGLDVRNQAQRKIREIIEGYFNNSRCCAVKDPRICLFIPLWLECCEDLGIETRIIIPFRHPLTVGHSLLKRDGALIERSMLLWSKYILAAERHTRGSRRTFLSYDRLLGAPQEALSGLIDQLGLQLPGERDRNVERGAAFLSSSLNRSAAGSPEATPRHRFPLDLYELCLAVDGSPAAGETAARFDAVQRQYDGFLQSVDPILADQVDAFRRHAVAFRSYWQDAANSRANRLAAPLRKLIGSMGRG